MKTNSILSNLTAPALLILLFAACESDNHATDDGPVAGTAQNTLSPLILWPQEAATASLSVTVSGISYSATLNLLDLPGITPATKGLAPGYSYVYNVKVHKTGLEISEAKITAWTTGTGGDADAKEE